MYLLLGLIANSVWLSSIKDLHGEEAARKAENDFYRGCGKLLWIFLVLYLLILFWPRAEANHNLVPCTADNLKGFMCAQQSR